MSYQPKKPPQKKSSYKTAYWLLGGLGGVAFVLGLILCVVLLTRLNNGLTSTPIPDSLPLPTATPRLQPSPTTRLNSTATPLPLTLPPSPSRPTASPNLQPPPSVSPSSILYPPSPTLSPANITALENGKIQAEYPSLNLTLIYERDSYGEKSLGEFLAHYQETFAYVYRYLQMSGTHKFTFELRTDGAPDPLGLGVRGFSDSQKNVAYQLYDGTGDPPDRKYITAHELAHSLMYKKVGGYAANLFLSEGLAMYASDEYLRQAEMVTLHDFAVAAYQQNRLVSMASLSEPQADFNGRLTARLNYDLAGSFVSWLIDTYGYDKFLQVYPKAQYFQVYGKNLGILNQEWVAWLADRAKNMPIKFDATIYFGYYDRITLGYRRLYAQAARNGNRLNQIAYAALDNGRLAAERLQFSQAEQALRRFETAISN